MDTLFREKHVEKSIYLAIVEGKTASKGELDHKLSHAGGTRKVKVSSADGDSNARLRFTTRVPWANVFHC
ncbi:MAG: hypothetical protein IPH00_11695 [Flavobacteriales bacterium]|nr:hypothetical protein [Flavobacteriales bacterium]